MLGYLAGSITDNSNTNTTSAYLFAMGEWTIFAVSYKEPSFHTKKSS